LRSLEFFSLTALRYIVEEFGIFFKSQENGGRIKNLKLEGGKKYMEYVNVYKPIVANIII